MSIKPLVLIGGGGHCKSCIEVIEKTGAFEIIGILDNTEKGTKILGYEVIGNDDYIPELNNRGLSFLITVGQIKSPSIRQKIFQDLVDIKADLPCIISPSAQVSRYAKLGAGTIVLHNTVINSDSLVGYNCIINSGAIIEHDSIIGNNTHISTNAVVNGNCKIGENCFIGSGSVISNAVTIADNAIIGAQSLILKDLLVPGIYVSENSLKRIG